MPAEPGTEPVSRIPESGGHTPVITNTATVTALGGDTQSLWLGISAGITALRPVGRFAVDNYGAKIAACIDNIKPSGGKSMIHPLLDRLFEGMDPIPPDAFLITATTKAGIDNLERFRRGVPVDTRDILLTALIHIVSKKLGLNGNGINISAACASSTIAVARGAAMIASGRTDAVLVCCADLVTEFIFSGFSALKALSPGPCRPFDRDRQGLSLGEGAAALLLMSRKRAERENRSVLGTVYGWGTASDATHITAPAPNGCGLVQAIFQALKVAGSQPDDIAAISAHGTGTVYNDLMELTAYRRIFGERKMPVYSIKGAIGHCLGAAGGIEVALGLKTLAKRITPPTVGLINPMKEARGRVSVESEAFSGDYLLTTNSGFGGVNAALILGK